MVAKAKYNYYDTVEIKGSSGLWYIIEVNKNKKNTNLGIIIYPTIQKT